MNIVRSLSVALFNTAFAATVLAAQNDWHRGHHPAGSASASNAVPGKTAPEMARMDAQMKIMREIHDRMAAAKTPDKRNDLMAEHMHAMNNGMTMMNGMSAGGTPHGGMAGVKGDMAARHQMMEMRMEMMHATMQMMMDRLPAGPAN